MCRQRRRTRCRPRSRSSPRTRTPSSVTYRFGVGLRGKGRASARGMPRVATEEGDASETSGYIEQHRTPFPWSGRLACGPGEHHAATGRRKEWDSNPRRPEDLNGFRGRPIRPLWHPPGSHASGRPPSAVSRGAAARAPGGSARRTANPRPWRQAVCRRQRLRDGRSGAVSGCSADRPRARCTHRRCRGSRRAQQALRR